jgi:hypothetical protein
MLRVLGFMKRLGNWGLEGKWFQRDEQNPTVFMIEPWKNK